MTTPCCRLSRSVPAVIDERNTPNHRVPTADRNVPSSCHGLKPSNRASSRVDSCPNTPNQHADRLEGKTRRNLSRGEHIVISLNPQNAIFQELVTETSSNTAKIIVVFNGIIGIPYARLWRGSNQRMIFHFSRWNSRRQVHDMSRSSTPGKSFQEKDPHKQCENQVQTISLPARIAYHAIISAAVFYCETQFSTCKFGTRRNSLVLFVTTQQ